MSKQRHDPHSGHDHIEGQQGQKTNAEIAKLRNRKEGEPGTDADSDKAADGRPHEPQKKEHG